MRCAHMLSMQSVLSFSLSLQLKLDNQDFLFPQSLDQEPILNLNNNKDTEQEQGTIPLVSRPLDDLFICIWISLLSQHQDNRETGYSNVLQYHKKTMHHQNIFTAKICFEQAMTSTRYFTLLGIFHYSYPTWKFYYSSESRE